MASGRAAAAREGLDDVRWRPDLGVPATEVDDRRPALGGGRGDPREQCAEVLLGQPLEAARTRACRLALGYDRPASLDHGPIVRAHRRLTPSEGFPTVLSNTRSSKPRNARGSARSNPWRPMLTDRQQQIWNYLVEYVDGHGYPPTVREIGEEVGLASPSTVHAHLANLERAGLLRRDPTKPRALELLGRERSEPGPPPPPSSLGAARLPLLGEIAAGAPSARRAEHRGVPHAFQARPAATSCSASGATR